MISSGKKSPQYSWKFEENGSIRVFAKTKPTEVVLWRANNPTARDFRLKTIGPAFESTTLKADVDGNYVAPPPPEQPGWTASFVELTYDVGGPFPLKVSTGVQILPDVLPFKGIELTEVKYEPEMAGQKTQTGK
jgi:PhoPQ-activated pathogenicity-related protein